MLEGPGFSTTAHLTDGLLVSANDAQMDLLCAPWTKSLEDGGHPVLKSKSDWANLERPPLASVQERQIIDAITSSGTKRRFFYRQLLRP